MGSTPSKKSKTGREVIERMKKQNRIRGTGANMEFLSSTDGTWYSIEDADMAHLTDAVTWWNKRGRFTGAKSKQVRRFMLSSCNYELEYYKHNRSQGAKLKEVYLPPIKIK